MILLYVQLDSRLKGNYMEHYGTGVSASFTLCSLNALEMFR